MFSWFALKVRARGEAQVGSLLRQKQYETFLPTYTDCRQYSDRIRKIESALFPGYLFCRFDAASRLPLLMTPGVQSIISFGDQPVPVDEAELQVIRRVVDTGADVRPWPWLTAGDRVRIECGAFAGVEGLLVNTKGSDQLILSVTLLQRSVAVEIDRSWVRPLDGYGRFRRTAA